MKSFLDPNPSFLGFTFRSAILALLSWSIAAAIAWVGFELHHDITTNAPRGAGEKDKIEHINK